MFNFVSLGLLSFKVLKSEQENKRMFNQLKITIPVSQNIPLDKQTSPAKGQSEVLKFISPEQNSEEELFGIDVSHWNGNIVMDLPKKDNLSFVICKATQGDRGIDPKFKSNWKFLSEHKMMKGAYHFYEYSKDPILQAAHFCDTVGKIELSDFSLVVDIEEMSLPAKDVNAQKLKNNLLKFLNYVEDHIQRVPIIYSDYSFLNKYLDDPIFSRYPLWLAEYSRNEKPKLPKVWKDKGCLIWQKTDSYHINSTATDYDVFYKK
ncbi:hypothetical protein IO90_10360 [Chryseobacterium sp. FH1]|nr:hypothetical protein IO90_10360 [Chryseobacterium sp. FH1]